jgi:succinate dehydrogenase/fumarate reductase flavoprotein subunit
MLSGPPRHWDEVCDVVVVGCGYAGAAAAIEAHDRGARVVILEKMPDPGGISICSAGGLRTAEDAEQAFAYLVATNGGTSDESVLRTLAEGMTTLADRLRGLAAVNGARVELRRATGNYPLPGHETFGFAYVEEVPDFDPAVAYPQVRGSPEGARLFKVMEDNLASRAIEARVSSPVQRLFADGTGTVLGVAYEGPQGPRTLRARRAVVLACGGFEGDGAMQRQYWQAKPVLSAAFRGNTGDGIRMAQALGADLWHMWHYHGSYGFRLPDPAYPFAVRTKRLPDWLPGEGPPPEVKMPWILLDKSGRRFMNEYEPYLQDTGARPFDRFLPETQEYAAIPCWFVADEVGRELYSFGRPTYHERGLAFDWSADNLSEVELGVLGRAEDLTALATALGIDADGLCHAIEKWNSACLDGLDGDFGRPASSMVPIAAPPYYYAQVWPVVSNTQGGPVHDARQRIIDVFGAPIPRLYAAGELGSVFGHLYMSGGNLAECFVGGQIAGRAAAEEVAMDER